jgi:hypothetical protein
MFFTLGNIENSGKRFSKLGSKVRTYFVDVVQSRVDLA